jgi:hypothetical protein
MKKERTFLTCLAAFIVLGSLLDTQTADGIYIAATLGFFLLCIAHAEWCSRL